MSSLGRLAVHYYRADFTPLAAKSLIEDMTDDLERYPHAEIEIAIRAYRLDEAQKFFPRAAQLISLIESERRHAAQVASPKRNLFEFGDSRPLEWEYTNPKYWKPHWCAADLNRATDPQRRARYDAWLARKESSDAS